MYRLAYVYTGWSERRAFAPVFLAFVLRGESFFAALADTSVHPPRRTCYRRKTQHILRSIAQVMEARGMLCSERRIYTRFNTAGLHCCFAVLFFFTCAAVARPKVGTAWTRGSAAGVGFFFFYTPSLKGCKRMCFFMVAIAAHMQKVHSVPCLTAKHGRV